MIPGFSAFKSLVEDAPLLAKWLQLYTRWTFEIVWLLMFSFINVISISKSFSITFFFENNDS